MRISKKWHWSWGWNMCAKPLQSCPTLCDPMDYILLDFSVHGILQARILEWVAMPFSRGSSWYRDQIQVSCITGRFFLLSEPLSENESHSVMSDSVRPHGLYSPWNSPGHNTEVGSLFLLQGIFPTQELNPGLLHCRRILYQLSHKGSCKSVLPFFV